MNYVSLIDIRENYPPSFNAAAPVWAHKDQVEARIAALEEELAFQKELLAQYHRANCQSETEGK